MIRIKMAVPEIGKEFDFAYNENALVDDIISDTIELIEQYSGISAQNTEEFVVYMVSTGEILNKSERLADYQVVNGETLILI
mgnify:FL=1